MASPYVADVLLRREMSPIDERIHVQDPVLLHARMRELRDHWTWVGEIDWPGRRVWRLRSFVYVRKGADSRLRRSLEAIVDRSPEAVSLDAGRAAS
jgi:hypothetical protein